MCVSGVFEMIVCVHCSPESLERVNDCLDVCFLWGGYKFEAFGQYG